MEKIYIATSTLNFNNILSTESISPEIFYSNRNFGYKRFNKVDPNPFSNSLIAYSKIPNFQIKESDFDDYPLILELSKDLLDSSSLKNSIQKDGVDIYQIHKTIYLHPSKFNFLVFSEKDKRNCLIKAVPSIETKLIPVYSPRIKLIDKTSNLFKWNKFVLKDLGDNQNNELLKLTELDLKLNKLKGFYYSYFLGIILSKSIKEISLKEEFISIAKLTFESLGKDNSNKFKEVLSKLNEFKSKIKKSIGDKTIPEQELIKAIYLEESEIKEQDKFLCFLKNTKPFENDFYSQLVESIKEKVDQNSLSILIDNFSDYIQSNISKEIFLSKTKRIASYVSKLEQPKKKALFPLFVIDNINFNGYKVTQLDDEIFTNKSGSGIYQNIINEILEYPINNIEDFKEERGNIAERIGKIFKESHSKWEGSQEQLYFNCLFDNIDNFQPFELKSHSNILLQSVAIFILKGDDPEKLLEALYNNRITDCRIAFGLWGAIFGFSALPKTITNKLFSEKNLDLTHSFYIDVQKKIHGLDFKERFQIEPYIKEEFSSSIQENNVDECNKNTFNEVIESKTEKLDQAEETPKCPKCGGSMLLKDGKYGKFYGCSKYGWDTKTSCDGKRDYATSKNKVPNNKSSLDFKFLIIEYLKQNNGTCKIKDLNKYLKKRTKTWSYNISTAKKYIENHISEEVVFINIYKEGSVAKKGAAGLRLKNKTTVEITQTVLKM